MRDTEAKGQRGSGDDRQWFTDAQDQGGQGSQRQRERKTDRQAVRQRDRKRAKLENRVIEWHRG